MDSLTQIVLGAAVGEVVAGKKIGNRAMAWGAVAGTIPDLDVLSNLFMGEMDALAFHRGFMHSIVFAIMAAPILGWLIHQLYAKEINQHRAYKIPMAMFGLLFYGAVVSLIAFFPVITGIGEMSMRSLIIGGFVGIPILYSSWNYIKNERPPLRGNATWQTWSWLFFWGIFTHPILDCFTSYGTQLFLPFSDYRVAWDVVSVADPIYTVPFLICLAIASLYNRQRPIRRVINYVGLTWSCLYLAFATYHKVRVNAILEQTLIAENIQYQRYITIPSIFNNVLWQGVVETEDAYYMGLYSFWDSEDKMQFDKFPKNHDFLSPYVDDREVKILTWFSNGYYNVEKDGNGKIFYNDLRFRMIGGDNEKFAFRFFIEKNGTEDTKVSQENRMDRPEDGLTALWARIKGI